MVRLLLSHSATEVNLATRDDRFTPLSIACWNEKEEIVKILLADSRTNRIRPDSVSYERNWLFRIGEGRDILERAVQVYDMSIRYVKSKRKARFRGLIRATVVFRRMRFRAAMIVYAPGGTGADAAAASFNNAASTHN